MKKNIVVHAVLLLLLCGNKLNAQQPVTLRQAVDTALLNNPELKMSVLSEKAASQMKRGWLDAAKSDLAVEYGNMNSAANDNKVTIGQSFSFPSVYTRQKKALEENYSSAREYTKLTGRQLEARVSTSFYEVIYLQEKKKLLEYADSLFRLFSARADKRFTAGETGVLEKTMALSQQQQVQQQLSILNTDLDIALKNFNLLLNSAAFCIPAVSSPKLEIPPVMVDSATLMQHPGIQLIDHQTASAHWKWKTEKAKKLPDIRLGYNNQTFVGWQNITGNETYYGTARRFSSVQGGVAIPLLGSAWSAKADAAKTEWERLQQEGIWMRTRTMNAYRVAQEEVSRNLKSIAYYEKNAIPNAQVIESAIDKQLSAGEINYIQWIVVANQLISIKSEYTDIVHRYNLSVIELNTFSIAATN